MGQAPGPGLGPGLTLAIAHDGGVQLALAIPGVVAQATAIQAHLVFEVLKKPRVAHAVAEPVRGAEGADAAERVRGGAKTEKGIDAFLERNRRHALAGGAAMAVATDSGHIWWIWLCRWPPEWL